MKKVFSIVVFALVITFGNAQQSYAMNFTDVPDSHGFSANMHYLFKEGVIQGFGDNQFRPDEAVTRGNASIMIAKALKLDTSNKNSGFSDVGKSSEAAGAIQAVKSKGIVTGYSDGKFYPNRQVTRAEMTILMARAFEMKETGYPTFKDISREMASYESIRKVLAYGVVAGYTDDTFRPNEILTRAQFSAFLSRAMNEDLRLSTKKPGSEKVTTKEAYAIGSQLTYDFGKAVTKLGNDNNWGFKNPGTVEISKPILEKHASKSFITKDLKPFIETYYCDCDFVNLPKVRDNHIRFTVLDATKDAFTVRVIELPNFITSTASYHVVRFKVEDNQWKIDGWEDVAIKEDLKLTKQEVEKGMSGPRSYPKVTGEYYSKSAGGLVYIVEDPSFPGKVGVGKADGNFYSDF